jgi:hypothetical protein
VGNWVLAVVLAVLNLPVYWVLGRFFFPTGADVLDTARLLLTPRLWDLLRGEAFDDQWAHFQFGAWLVLCVVTVASEHFFIRHHFPALVERLGSWWAVHRPAQ